MMACGLDRSVVLLSFTLIGFPWTTVIIASVATSAQPQMRLIAGFACASHMRCHQQPTCTQRRLRPKREQGKLGTQRRWWWRVLIDHEMQTQQPDKEHECLPSQWDKASSGDWFEGCKFKFVKTRLGVRQSSSMLSRCHHHPHHQSSDCFANSITSMVHRRCPSRLSTAKELVKTGTGADDEQIRQTR